MRSGGRKAARPLTHGSVVSPVRLLARSRQCGCLVRMTEESEVGGAGMGREKGEPRRKLEEWLL